MNAHNAPAFWDRLTRDAERAALPDDATYYAERRDYARIQLYAWIYFAHAARDDDSHVPYLLRQVYRYAVQLAHAARAD